MVSGLLSWIAKSRSALTDLDECMVDRYLRHRARKHSIERGDRAALVKWWLSVLRDAGTIAQPALSPVTPQDQPVVASKSPLAASSNHTNLPSGLTQRKVKAYDGLPGQSARTRVLSLVRSSGCT